MSFNQKTYMRKWRQAHAEERREYARQYRRANRAKLYKHDARWRAKAHANSDPRLKARWQLNSAIRAGKIVRQPCEICGSYKAQAHHEDYSKPFDVRWLCKQHHIEHHHACDAKASARATTKAHGEVGACSRPCRSAVTSTDDLQQQQERRHK